MAQLMKYFSSQFGSDSGSRMDPSFDVVLADLPYLSEECLTKTAITIRYRTVLNTKAGNIIRVPDWQYP